MIIVVDNHYNQDELRMGKHNDNKQLTKQVVGLFGDTLFALIIGVVGLFIFGAVVAIIWDLVNKVL